MKTVKKKLYRGPVIEVDEAIYRWRKRLKKNNIKLGRGMQAAEKKAKQASKDYADKKTPLTKKAWF